jgi:cell division septation protein DedD
MIDNNLDDLIIDNPKSGRNPLKSILTILILILVIVVFAIIFTKTVLDDSSSAKKELEEDVRSHHPDLIYKEKPPTLKEFTIEEKIGEKSETPIKKEIITFNGKDLSVENSSKQTIQEKTQKHTSDTNITNTQNKIKNKTTTTEKTEERETTETKVETSTKEKPEKSTYQQETTTSLSASSEAYYIQVGYFAKQPSKQFIETIDSHGFKHTMVPHGEKGAKKLLIGPYTTRQKVEAMLPKVRNTINKRAFILKR